MEKPVFAHFLRRKNRFVAEVELDGHSIDVYIPNTGRLPDVLIPGNLVALKAMSTKLPFKMVGAQTKEGVWVSVEATRVNFFFKKWAAEGLIFPQYEILRAEAPLGIGRVDFLLRNCETQKQMLVEVKSCTLVKKGVAMFPDAPTLRGRRHIQDISELVQKGVAEGAIVFVAAREDALAFEPNWQVDAKFSESLIRAAKIGVKLFLVRSRYNVLSNELDFLQLKQLNL